MSSIGLRRIQFTIRNRIYFCGRGITINVQKSPVGISCFAVRRDDTNPQRWIIQRVPEIFFRGPNLPCLFSNDLFKTLPVIAVLGYKFPFNQGIFNSQQYFFSIERFEDIVISSLFHTGNGDITIWNCRNHDWGNIGISRHYVIQ